MKHQGCSGACDCGGNMTDRRQFLQHGAAAAAAFALMACGLAGPTVPSSSISPTTLKLSDYPTLANVGGVATLQISGVPVALVRESTTTISAFSRICPHAGNIVQPIGSQGFYCPGHGAQFSLTGQWIGGQRTTNLTALSVQYDAAAATVTVSN
jgi:Rieske Fe-S protein